MGYRFGSIRLEGKACSTNKASSSSACNSCAKVLLVLWDERLAFTFAGEGSFPGASSMRVCSQDLGSWVARMRRRKDSSAQKACGGISTHTHKHTHTTQFELARLSCLKPRCSMLACRALGSAERDNLQALSIQSGPVEA